MRSPFTGIIFTLELTHDINMLLPLMVACVVAHGFTVIVMRRSILTEKVSRRGYHLSREYAVDPLEIIFVREVMRTSIVALPDTISRKELLNLLENTHQRNHQLQRLYPVVDAEQLMKGVVTRTDLQVLQQRLAAETVGTDGQSGHDGHDMVLVNHETGQDDGGFLPKMLHKQPTVAYPDEPLRSVVYRMAETGHTRLPVVERNNPRKLVGLVSLYDLLKARTRNLEEERRRERILRLRLLFAARGENESESESEERVK